MEKREKKMEIEKKEEREEIGGDNGVLVEKRKEKEYL